MSNLITYKDGEPFPGVIGRTADESSPAWPTPPQAPDGAPNVVMFVLDDVGFGQRGLERGGNLLRDGSGNA